MLKLKIAEILSTYTTSCKRYDDERAAACGVHSRLVRSVDTVVVQHAVFAIADGLLESLARLQQRDEPRGTDAKDDVGGGSIVATVGEVAPISALSREDAPPPAAGWASDGADHRDECAGRGAVPLVSRRVAQILLPSGVRYEPLAVHAGLLD